MKVDPKRAAAVLEGLNPEQRAVATSFGAPVVVLAGAGTGKTRAITHRIAYGAFSGQSDPRRTLAVTFTNKAAGELRHRLGALGLPSVQGRTFHSAALRQVRFFWPQVNGHELPPLARSRFSLIAEAARAEHLSVDTALLRDLAGEISWSKVSNVPIDRYPELAVKAGRELGRVTPEQVSNVLERYEQVKKRREEIDFDDILLCAIALLHSHPEIAARIRDQYRHFTVDEYQDVSPVQRTLLELWLGDGDDVCVVGDVNQSIHTFAGAQPAYLTNFAKQHRGAVTLQLTTNYRSTPQVLAAANAVIGRGARLRPTRDDGPELVIAPADDEPTEAAEVASWLAAEHAAGRSWAQMGVLYRINAQSEELQTALNAAAIPFTVRDPDAEGEARSGDVESAEAVTLSTMHAAKGLEWESVAVIGLSDGLMPFVMANTPAAQAEERRLLYVALTRARTGLRLSWASGGADGRGHREPSRYLRWAGLVAEAGRPNSRRNPKTPRVRQARRLPDCYVCGRSLSGSDEIKLGRHHGCPATFDEALFERLRQWRLGVAQAQSMPAFVIFTDATLRAIAEQRPTDQAGLLRIPGIGMTKVERHGADLLAMVRQVCD